MLKQDVIMMAYSHLTINGITLGPDNEDVSLGLDILEDMAHELFSRNICAGYNFQDEPDPSDEIGIDRQYANAFKTNLALRLVSAFGKQVPQVLAAQANASMSNMSARTSRVRETSYPHRQPRGGANTLRFNRWRRYYYPETKAPIGCSTNKLAIGNVNDYIEHFEEYLKEGEDIDTVTIDQSEALLLESSSNTFTDVLYRIKAKDPHTRINTLQQVKITITTTDGRIKTRYVNFEII